MSPRAFDPMQRARDFPRMPSPRRQRLNVEHRLDRVESLTDLALSLATQPEADTPIETLFELPVATSADLGRQVIVQLPDETITSIYVGIQLPDGTTTWQLMAAGMAIGGETSPEFTFLGNVAEGLVVDSGAYEDSAAIWITLPASDMRRYVKSTGVTHTPFASSTGEFAGIAVTFDASGDFYIARPGSNRIRRYDSSGNTEQTTPTSRAYNSIYHRSGQGHLLSTSAVQNEWYKITTSTLAIANTVSASINAPEGICEDSSGNIYVANSGANAIRKYNASLTFQIAWGSAGSGDGQLSTPKQMWVDGSDRIYVADSGNDRIQVFDPSGAFLGKFASFGSGSGQIDNPRSVTGYGTSISVTDPGNERVSRWTRN